MLAGWIGWVRPSRLSHFIALAKTLNRFQQLMTEHWRATQDQSEAVNTHLRALTRLSNGSHSP